MLITNGKIIVWDGQIQVHEGDALKIDGSLIKEISPQQSLIEKYPDEEVIDASGQYVMPGSICAHTHFYGAYARGMGIPGDAPKDFPEILNKLWWPLDQALDPVAIRHSALVCLVDAIKYGTTTLFDHHASPNSIDGSLDIIAETILEAGLRGSLCYEVTDRGGYERTRQGIAENVRFARRVSENNADHHLAASFGLHASLTVSDKTLTTCREAIDDAIGFHIHVAEHEVDEYDSIAKSGMRTVDRLAKFGILGNRSITVHCVHIDPREIQLLAESGTWVTHQPRSNMNNGVGLGEVEGMLRAGVKVGLGNDGFSNAMWEEWKTAYLAHKLWRRDPRRMGADTIAQMALGNNAAMATQQFGAEIGYIKAGAQADLIFVDYQPFTPLTEGNLPWHIVFGFQPGMVTGTMVGGKLLMWNRQLLTLDEHKIMAEAIAYAPKVWKKYETLI